MQEVEKVDQLITCPKIASAALRPRSAEPPLRVGRIPCLMLQAVIERQVRRRMQADGLDAIPIYPEHRQASHPTTTKIVDRFYDVSTYELTEGNQVLETFKDEFTETQKELLSLLQMRVHQYWQFAE